MWPYSLPICGEKYLFDVGVAMIVLPVAAAILVSSTVSMSIHASRCTLRVINAVTQSQLRDCIDALLRTFVVFSGDVLRFVFFDVSLDVCVYTSE